ncbi:uncharacterized protein LOC117111227 [Anneissia japonica]|uniref:uncharacterized protein LOC117111227 n=1 Tax=Anneissia japonica TaxID=1529436 RepID=UPI001425A0A2|nr:uncharacterized protein LOC117111227 [Anneissia japonica]
MTSENTILTECVQRTAMVRGADDLSSHIPSTAFVTIIIVSFFVFTKSIYEYIKKRRTKLNLIIVGSGPIGLTTAIIAAQNKRISRITLYESKPRQNLFVRPQQIALDRRSIHFLKSLKIDFNAIEGCWENDRFFTRVGTFQEHLLEILKKLDADLEIKFGCKFTEDIMRNVCKNEKTKISLMVVCDGVRGDTASLLGLSDEYILCSCNAYGAMASLDRMYHKHVAVAETTRNNMKLDLSAFGSEYRQPELTKPTFKFKIFGTYRYRYLTLSCPKNGSNVLRQLRITSDSSVIRHIFQESFNSYRTKREKKISDAEAISMHCSRRMTEIKLSYRRENVALIEDENIIVSVEGDATRTTNFHTGSEVNMGFRGLESIHQFIIDIAMADKRDLLIETLTQKVRHSQKVVDEFLRNGLTIQVH